jgi:hypothetical protein
LFAILSLYQLCKGFFKSVNSLNVNRIVHLSSFAFWSPSSVILPALVFGTYVPRSELLSPASIFVMWAFLKAICTKSLEEEFQLPIRWL